MDTETKETVEQLEERLPNMTDEELAGAHKVEEDGDNRTTALEAIDREIKRRQDTSNSNGPNALTPPETKPAAERKSRAPRAKADTEAPTAAGLAFDATSGIVDADERITAIKEGEDLELAFGDGTSEIGELVRKPAYASAFSTVGGRAMFGADVKFEGIRIDGSRQLERVAIVKGDTVIATCELASKIPVRNGGSIHLPSGSLIFDAPIAA